MGLFYRPRYLHVAVHAIWIAPPCVTLRTPFAVNVLCDAVSVPPRTSTAPAGLASNVQPSMRSTPPSAVSAGMLVDPRKVRPRKVRRRPVREWLLTSPSVSVRMEAFVVAASAPTSTAAPGVALEMRSSADKYFVAR